LATLLKDFGFHTLIKSNLHAKYKSLKNNIEKDFCVLQSVAMLQHVLQQINAVKYLSENNNRKIKGKCLKG